MERKYPRKLGLRYTHVKEYSTYKRVLKTVYVIKEGLTKANDDFKEDLNNLYGKGFL